MSHTRDSQQSSYLADGLRSITGLVSRRPRVALWMVGISVCMAVVFTVGYLQFKTDRADLIDPQADFHKRWLDYTENFGDDSDIVVVVEGNDPDEVKGTIDKLAERLAAEPKLFSHTLYKVDAGELKRKGLQYTAPGSLSAGLNRVDAMRPIIEGRWEETKLQNVANRLRYQLDWSVRNLPRTETERLRHAAQAEALLDHAGRLTSSLANYDPATGEFYLPWPDIVTVDPKLQEEDRRTVYFLSDDGMMGFVRTRPAEGAADGFDGPTPVIDRLREIADEIQAERLAAAGTTSLPVAVEASNSSEVDAEATTAPKSTDLRIGLTGIPVLENDEMRKSKSDMIKASAISLLGVCVLLCFGFRGLRHPMLAIIMLLVGMAWAFGFTTLVVGHLNILSVSFAAILIGLGIDFAIHYLARYLEVRSEGDDLLSGLREASGSVGVGIVAAAVTTALAFFCATLTQFLGVAELGIIAGGGILLCALATFVVLPALIAISDADNDPKPVPGLLRANYLAALTARYPTIVAVGSLAIVIGLGASIFRYSDGEFDTRVTYDHNLLNLQAEGLESVELERRISEKQGNSILYAVAVADSAEEAQELRLKFEALPTVSHVEELGSRLPLHNNDRTGLLVQAYRAKLANLTQPPSREQMQVASARTTGQALDQLYQSLVRVSRSPLDGTLTADASRSAAELDGYLNRLSSKNGTRQRDEVNAYQARMTYSLYAQLRGVATAADPAPITTEDFPEELRARYISDSGQWLIQIFPNEPIWEIEPLERFVADVRSVDPEATGTPLQNYEASRQIKASYERAALYAVAVILVVLLFDFLRSELKVLVLLPPLLIVVFYGVVEYMNGSPPNFVLLVILYLTAVGFFSALLDATNLRDALLAIVPSVVGGAMMLGIFGLLGIALNPANLIVLPLVLGIGVDDGVHVVHDFRRQRGENYRTSGSVLSGIILTSLTSMIGFGSMMVASHRGLFSVGLTLVIGVGCCLFASLVLLPSLLVLLTRGPKEQSRKQSEREDNSGNASGGNEGSRRSGRRGKNAA